MNRSRRRSPKLSGWDRILAGLTAVLVRPTRLFRSAIVLKPRHCQAFCGWRVFQPFGVTPQGGLPVTLLIDRAGKIADSHVGMANKDGFEKEIQTLLKEPAK